MTERYLCRGKRLDSGEWVEGYYCRIRRPNKECDYIIPRYSSAAYGSKVIPATVGRCTGLRDKKWKLIFEGDLVWLPTNHIGEIAWLDSEARFVIRYDGYIQGDFESFWHYDMVVTGNAIDNRNLIRRW